MDLYTYAVDIVRVVDGDTAIVHISLGFGVWLHQMRVRLAHINAPELPTEAGQAAANYLRSLLGPWTPPRPVLMQSLKDRQDNYGRYLGVFFAEDVNVNDAMLAAGHAVPSEGRRL